MRIFHHVDYTLTFSRFVGLFFFFFLAIPSREEFCSRKSAIFHFPDITIRPIFRQKCYSQLPLSSYSLISHSRDFNFRYFNTAAGAHRSGDSRESEKPPWSTEHRPARIFSNPFRPARLIIDGNESMLGHSHHEYDANVPGAVRASVARGDFSEPSFSGGLLARHPRKIGGRTEKENGTALYSGIMYYKWRHSQGRHYQTLAPSRIPPTSPPSVARPARLPSIHSARELSIRTAELLCRLIDSLSERCEVRYSTRYGFNFMPIISVQKRRRRREGEGERAGRTATRGGWIFAMLGSCSFLLRRG